MSRPSDMVVGVIKNLEMDRLSGWSAFFKKDAECEALKKELKAYKERIGNKRHSKKSQA